MSNSGKNDNNNNDDAISSSAQDDDTQRNPDRLRRSTTSTSRGTTTTGNNNNNSSSSRPRIRLRNATVDADLTILQEWDKKPHVIACGGMDDNDKDGDWDWLYELPRTDLSWRYQLIAVVLDEDVDAGMGKSMGCIQIIDPLMEETHYWGGGLRTQFARH
jgi:hypothetical protein